MTCTRICQGFNYLAILVEQSDKRFQTFLLHGFVLAALVGSGTLAGTFSRVALFWDSDIGDYLQTLLPFLTPAASSFPARFGHIFRRHSFITNTVSQDPLLMGNISTLKS